MEMPVNNLIIIHDKIQVTQKQVNLLLKVNLQILHEHIYGSHTNYDFDYCTGFFLIEGLTL